MIRIGSLTVVATAMLVASGMSTNVQAQDSFMVVSWGGVYQDAERFALFQPAAEELGIEITEDTLSGMADIRLQVLSGEVTWDIVELGSASCVQGANEGLFEKLDFDVIDVDGMAQGTYDDHWVGVMYYSTVLAWNTDKFGDRGPRNWVDFWNVAKFPGSRSLYNSAGSMLEVALLADGVPIDQLYPLDVDRAFKKLEEIRPHVDVWWTSGAQSAQLIKDGEVDMIALWVSRVIGAMNDGAHADYTFNQGMLDFGCFVIPKGSKKKDLAMKVLNKFVSPSLQANLPQHIDYGPVNAKAFETGKISPETTATLNSSPTNVKLQYVYDVKWWAENGPAMQERWDEFMTE